MWDITVLRAEPGATPTEDDYGNPVHDAEEAVQTFRALFAPSNSEEQTEPGRNAVIRGGTVYKRGPRVPDVREHDHVLIEGTRYAVEGVLGEWRNRTGRTIGSQFGVKAVAG